MRKTIALFALVLVAPAVADENFLIDVGGLNRTSLGIAEQAVSVTNHTGHAIKTLMVECGLYDAQTRLLAVERGMAYNVPDNAKAFVSVEFTTGYDGAVSAQCRANDQGQ